jgi:hypothetical protein
MAPGKACDRDPAWPPGTARIKGLRGTDYAHTHGEIILQPRPTSDPNDPLVRSYVPFHLLRDNHLIQRTLQNWPLWRKNLNFFLASFYSFMVWAL